MVVSLQGSCLPGGVPQLAHYRTEDLRLSSRTTSDATCLSARAWSQPVPEFGGPRDHKRGRYLGYRYTWGQAAEGVWR